MIQFLIKTFIKNHEKTEDRAVRTAYGNLASLVGMACNLLLCLGKLAAGTLLGAEGQAQQTSGEPDAAQEQPVQYTDLPLDAEGYPVE